MFNSQAMSQAGLSFEAQFVILSTGTLVIFQDPNPVHLCMIILQNFTQVRLYIQHKFVPQIQLSSNHLSFSSLESHFSFSWFNISGHCWEEPPPAAITML